MTFIKSPKKALLLICLITLSFALSKAKTIVKKAGSSTKDYNQDALKKYFEIGLNVKAFGADETKCWDFVWGKGYRSYDKFFKSFWETVIEPFKKATSTVKLDIDANMVTLIDNTIKNEVKIDETQNPVACQTFLNSKRIQGIAADEVKTKALAALNIIQPGPPEKPKLFVTSAVSSHRDIVPNKNIFKVLNERSS